MSAAQSRAAAEHQTKRFHIGGVDRRKRLDDIPVLFDQCWAWQLKMSLNFEQILWAPRERLSDYDFLEGDAEFIKGLKP